MYKTKLAIIIDNIFISIIIFIITFVWLFKKTKNAILAFFICNIISVLVFFVILKLTLKKHKLQNLKNKDLKLAEKCFNTLKFIDNESYKNYFEKLLDIEFLEHKIYKNKELNFYIETRHELSEDDFTYANNFFLKNSNKPLCFICETASQNFMKLIESSPNTYEVYTSIDLFNIINAKKIYPFNIEDTQKTKNKFKIYKHKFTQSFTRNHFKDFFFSGISLIILSLIIPYSFYYMVFGSLLLLFSIISLFNKSKTNITNSKTSLADILNIKKDA